MQTWPSLFKEIAALVPSLSCFTGSGSCDCCVPRATSAFFGIFLVLVPRLTNLKFRENICAEVPGQRTVLRAFQFFSSGYGG